MQGSMACRSGVVRVARAPTGAVGRRKARRNEDGGATCEGAANCVEIVVIVSGSARDFWREMPSGNAPAPLDRRH